MNEVLALELDGDFFFLFWWIKSATSRITSLLDELVLFEATDFLLVLLPLLLLREEVDVLVLNPLPEVLDPRVEETSESDAVGQKIDLQKVATLLIHGPCLRLEEVAVDV